MLNIYVDFDDCLCETAKHFTALVAEKFGKNVPYEQMRDFDLQKTFALTDEQYINMMEEAHRPESLLSYEETPGAVSTINGWIDRGDNVSIITGRPFSSFDASRQWLDEHGLERVKLFCLNKYSRDGFYKNNEYCLELDEYYKMKFDFAVEDSPAAFKFFGHLPDLKVMVFDRPWNHESPLPGDNFRRCDGWETIKGLV